MTNDYQTHVFTSTYTADVSGVCSAMYELGGMTVLHDPSGCNSTYSTHDEPRWFDTDSLMYVSGLDELTAVMGDDDVLIRDVKQAAADLRPRFITLCGASIPHIIAFDFRGVARLIEAACGIPVLPVRTNGLKSYVSGVGLALTAWLERFADPSEARGAPENSVNIVGATPLDFSVNDNIPRLRAALENAGFKVNVCMAMGEDFDSMARAYRAKANVVVSSAGMAAAEHMRRRAGIPCVRGLPAGPDQARVLAETLRQTLTDGQSRSAWRAFEMPGRYEAPAGGILVIGEEVFAHSLANAVNLLPPEKRGGLTACPYWPDVDEGLPERELARAMRASRVVIADPLYRVVLRRDGGTRFIDFPHEAYSGRIYRDAMPVFASDTYSVEKLLKAAFA